jgi:hypothetical protein
VSEPLSRVAAAGEKRQSKHRALGQAITILMKGLTTTARLA